MLQRELKALQTRKALLLEQSSVWRSDLERDLGPLRDLSGRIDRGMAIARQARDIALAFAPVLGVFLKRKGGVAKASASLIANWGLVRGAWAGFQAARNISR